MFNKNKIITINVILIVFNLIFLILIQPKNTIFTNIMFSISMLFAENIILTILSVLVHIGRKELIATKTQKQRDFMRLLNKITFNNPIYFEFIPNMGELSQVSEFKEIFSESDKIDALASKYLKDYILIGTEDFMNDLVNISNNQDFIKELAIVDASYKQDKFEQSRYKLEIYQQNFDRKMKVFLENSTFNVRINFKGLVENYPNYVREMSIVYNENKDLLDDLSRKDIPYNSDFKEFFDILFLNFDNDKKEEGYLVFKESIENISKDSFQSGEDFDNNIEMFKNSI